MIAQPSACLLCCSQSATLLFRASDRLYHTTTREFAVVRCAQCGLMRLDPQPAAAELRLYYPDTYWFAADRSAASRLEESYRRLVLRDHIHFVEQALRRSPARGPLLDVGSGGGLFPALMRERGFRAVGLDFSREAAAISWRQHRAPAVCAMLENAPIAERSLAGVTMFHVLEHLPDPRAYLHAAHALLAPDGRLVIQVPNAACWQFRLLGRSWNGVDVPRHLFDFRDRDVEKLLEQCGFEVLRRKYFSLRDNPAGLASSLAPSLDPMARRVRRVTETSRLRLFRDLAYFALVISSLPFAVVEAAFRAGSTVMIEARRR